MTAVARELRAPGDTQVLGSVSNAARLLREFGKGDRELGVSDLSRRLGLSKSTTHRLLHTLTVEGLLEQVPSTGHYRLAALVHDLAASARPLEDSPAGAAGPGTAIRQEGSR